MKSIGILLILLLLGSFSTLRAQTFTVSSPDNNLRVIVKVTDSLSWSVDFQQHKVINNATIALALDGNVLPGKKPVLLSNFVSTHNEELSAVVAVKDEKIPDVCQQLTLEFNNGISAEFRVYNEGVAYRFITSGKHAVEITSETMELRFPDGTISHFPQEQRMYSHYERAFLVKSVDTISKGSFCSLPVLFTTKDSVRILLTESDLFDYPGMFMKSAGNGLMQATFPKYVIKTEPASKGPDRNQVITKEGDYIAHTQGNRTYPWRVFIISNDDRTLVETNLVYQLSRPSEIQETDWIKPGKVAWDWYNANNIFGVDFPSGINTSTYKYYIDFAHAYGLEYIILDEGWSKSTTDVLATNPEIDLPALVSYGRSKNVGIILWLLWQPLDSEKEKILKNYHDWGIKGVKVDFMQRSDQSMVNSYSTIAEIASKYQLLVDFHGAYKPAGLNRRYPNVLSFEGVRGNEHNKWSDNASPEHNVTLPFIRMVAGPMDYTPGAMRNAQKKDFTVSFNTPQSQGTRCHQVAMYVVFESPLQMLCDLPSLYYKEKETTDFISKIPTVWQETRVLKGKVGDYIVVARRNGNNWYIGAMTDWTERDLDIELAFLPTGEYSLEVMKDGINAAKNAVDYKKEILRVSEKTKLHLNLAPGGGWAGIITQQ